MNLTQDEKNDVRNAIIGFYFYQTGVAMRDFANRLEKMQFLSFAIVILGVAFSLFVLPKDVTLYGLFATMLVFFLAGHFSMARAKSRLEFYSPKQHVHVQIKEIDDSTLEGEDKELFLRVIASFLGKSKEPLVTILSQLHESSPLWNLSFMKELDRIALWKTIQGVQ
jgi:hypothetical protein